MRDESEYGPANSTWATLDDVAILEAPEIIVMPA